jgi:hypothetical protein
MTNDLYLSSLHVAKGGRVTSESAPCGSNGKGEVNKICRDPGSNRGPLDLQIFIRAKANIKEGNAQLCMYTEI